MKLKFLLLAGLFPLLCQGQIVKSFKQLSDRVNVTLEDGTLSISPLSDNAVRIKFYKVSEGNLPELVFTSGSVTPVFQVVDSPSKLEIKAAKITTNVQNKRISKIPNTKPAIANPFPIFLSLPVCANPTALKMTPKVPR